MNQGELQELEHKGKGLLRIIMVEFFGAIFGSVVPQTSVPDASSADGQRERDFTCDGYEGKGKTKLTVIPFIQ